MDDLQKLMWIEEIKQVKARRCRAVDTQDWDLYRACHTTDCKSYALAFEDSDKAVTGIDAMIKVIRERFRGRTSAHHVHSPEIAFVSDTEAEGHWAMEDMLWWEKDGQTCWQHGYGRYFETYERIDGRWLIASRRLIRSRVDTGVVAATDLMKANAGR